DLCLYLLSQQANPLDKDNKDFRLGTHVISARCVEIPSLNLLAYLRFLTLFRR
ncbi:unnamed protein product, partial [Durusdinium trenchii]